MNVVYLGSTSKENLDNNIKIVASAGMLSRSKGTVMDVINSRDDYEKNIKTSKIIAGGYGHASISEHQYLVFALENVTPIVEQTLINHRLTSFTIKSRRNVDFRNVGFYVPNFKYKDGSILPNNQELQNKYSNYMQSLFSKYGNLVDKELPVEDCRYILPYCYHSNIIMGCDANELLKIVSRLKYGVESKISELKELGDKFEEIMTTVTPYFLDKIKMQETDIKYQDNLSFLDSKINNDNTLLSGVNLTDYSKDADMKVGLAILKKRYQLSDAKSSKVLEELLRDDPNILDNMITHLFKNDYAREAEQVNYNFEMPISLAALTHITRHRMHSLMVPNFAPLWNLDNYIIPDSIALDNLNWYKNIFEENKKMVSEFKQYGIRDEDLIYFYLSGNALNIFTNMNARTLIWISRMRCCNKAQWEIRDLINSCVEKVREVSPLIGQCLGSTCYVEGYCPEGNDSCKRGPVIIKKH